jgi:hypothetical protein
VKDHPAFGLRGGISISAFAEHMDAVPARSDEGPDGQVLAVLDLNECDVDRVEAVFVHDRLITVEIRLSPKSSIDPLKLFEIFGKARAASEDQLHLVWSQTQSKCTVVAQFVVAQVVTTKPVGDQWVVTRRFYAPLLEMGLTTELYVRRQLGAPQSGS